MRTQLTYLLAFALLYATTSAWSSNPTFCRRFGAGLLSVVALDISTTFTSPALADGSDIVNLSTSSSVLELDPSPDAESARIERKIAKQRAMSGRSKSGSDDGNDGSYMSSLQKEQAKQKAQKRSKAQKAKDLCETLGRGC
jgi:hypothetical protein